MNIRAAVAATALGAATMRGCPVDAPSYEEQMEAYDCTIIVQTTGPGEYFRGSVCHNLPAGTGQHLVVAYNGCPTKQGPRVGNHQPSNVYDNGCSATDQTVWFT